MSSLTTQFITRTYQKPYRPAKLQRAVSLDKPTQNNPADPYGEFIHELARKFTNSPEEAEAAVQEMNADIQRCSEKGIRLLKNEDRLIERIAFRRLIKFLRWSPTGL